MGFIGTGLSKLGAASAQQLGIAAAASLSVMAVTVTEKKCYDRRKSFSRSFL